MASGEGSHRQGAERKARRSPPCFALVLWCFGRFLKIKKNAEDFLIFRFCQVMFASLGAISTSPFALHSLFC